MNELIKIHDYNGKGTVSARELYNFLGYEESKFSRWFNNKIIHNEFAIENIDYQRLDLVVEMPNNASKTIKDAALTIEFSKKLSMMAKTEKGEQARNYFIAIEKKALQPINQLDFMQMQLDMMKDQSKRIDALEQKVSEIKALPQTNSPIEHFSIMGYCHNTKRQISLNVAQAYGIKCRVLCNQLGFVIGKVPDPRFGMVNTYPLDVLKQVIG